MKSALLVLAVMLLSAAPVTGQSSAPRQIALVNGTVYASPTQPPSLNTVVVLEGGRIAAVGRRAEVRIPATAETIDCTGLIIVPGFWNSHAHFTDPQWENAATLPASRLSEQFERMLTRYGFTTVFDTASLLENTLALRARVTRGEVRGPRIFTAGEPFGARNGTPFYLKPIQLPELLTVTQAASAARMRLAAGADAIKLHAGAITVREENLQVAIEPDLIRAVSREAHRQGKPVLAHPQYLDGLRNAVEGDVDVLLHVTEQMDRWPQTLLSEAIRKHVALIPTLKLLAGMQPSPKQQALLGQVREYRQSGGQILFGTDVGFITDYDPTDEYILMQHAGMSAMDILAALTVNPSSRFRAGQNTAQIAAGSEADLTILAGDPVRDVRNFTRVRYTIRAGELIYRTRE